MTPTGSAERIQALDILRGFAVFGILAVNIAGFAGPVFLPGYEYPEFIPWFDELAKGLITLFAESKFFTIFSFLFGLGFSVQIVRSEAKGRNIKTFYPRRLWLLFVIGILHTVFLWTGDILRLYALLGFALLAFHNRSNRTLIIWIIVLLVISFLTIGLFGGEAGKIPGYDILGKARSTYNSPSYLNVLIFQFFSGFSSFAIIFLLQGPSVMALFLLGLLAGRLKFFESLPENRTILKRALWIGLITGLIGNGFFLWVEDPWLSSLAITFGSPTMSAAYVCGLTLLSISRRGLKLLVPFVSVGRMALTNYVLQSVICLFLFSGFGLGWYEKIGAAGLLGLAVLIYLLQIPFSALWLRRFRFGPLEWIWRSLTYRQWQAIRKTDRNPAHSMKEKWNQRYAAKKYIFGKEPNAFLKEQIAKLSQGKILLLGEGEGRNAVYAAKLGWEVTAVDFSDEAKKKAEALAKESGVNIEYIVKDISSFAHKKNEYDAIALIFLHLPEKLRKSVHNKVVDALKPGGTLIAEFYEKEQLKYNSGGPPNSDLLYSLENIANDFKILDFLHFVKEEAQVSEGILHHGKAMVIRFVGRG